jgi:DNA-binding transcriptional LysR family regulator
MELGQLRTFVMVAACGSFTQVARELNISQPAVTAQIQALERELEVRLLDRLPRRVLLTPAGEVLLDYARRLLNLEAEAQRALAEVCGRQESYLHIGASPTIGEYILPHILDEFRQIYPSVHVIAEIKPTYEVVQAIQDHVYNLGLIEAAADTDGLEMEPFLQDELVLVVPGHHPWAAQSMVEPAELVNEPWITREPGSGTRAWIEESLHSLGVVITPVMELGGIEAIKNTVAAGMGISILSRSAVQLEVNSGILVVVKVRGVSLIRSFYCIYPRQRYLSPIIKSFLALVKNTHSVT